MSEIRAAADMDIYPIRFSKALLNKVPEDERTFHLIAGQLANDLNILSKLIIILLNPVSGHEILRRANTTSAILLIKLLAGRLNEGWELMCRQFLPSNQSDRKRRPDHVSIYRRYAADFDDNAKAQLGKIEKYFGKKNNIVRTIRNRASFHADPTVLTKGYAKFTDDEIFVDFHSQYRGHCLYFSSEIINLLGMIQLANKTDWKSGIDQIVCETIEVADWFGDVILAFITAFTMKYIEPTLGDVEADKITINDGPPIDAVTIPFFCRPRARKK
jgi:hypothetical protein